MIERIKSGDVKGTSLADNIAFFQLESQIYRIHISKMEDPIIYTKGIRVQEDEDEGEDLQIPGIDVNDNELELIKGEKKDAE